MPRDLPRPALEDTEQRLANHEAARLLRQIVSGFLLATGISMTSPPPCAIALAMRPPWVTTNAFAPARVSASAISSVANSLPPVSRRGTTCNIVTGAMDGCFEPFLRKCMTKNHNFFN